MEMKKVREGGDKNVRRHDGKLERKRIGEMKLRNRKGDSGKMGHMSENEMLEKIRTNVVNSMTRIDKTKIKTKEVRGYPDRNRIGRYTVIKLLGEGGEGNVYLARDDELHRMVAIKQMREYTEEQRSRIKKEIMKNAEEEKQCKEEEQSKEKEQCTEEEQSKEKEQCTEEEQCKEEEQSEEKEQCTEEKQCNEEKEERKIMQEADFLQQFRHPMLPVVYDMVWDGAWYMVMEYIQGLTLREYIERNGYVQEEQARKWTEQILDILGYLHTRKPPVIYRDLKPDNIMVCPDGYLKLIDFGAACLRGFGARERGIMAVTAGFGAPEQFGKTGSIEDYCKNGQTAQGYMEQRIYADERSDIYAVGMVLYYMVTAADPGKPPYALLPIRDYQPLLSDRLERIIRKCTKKEVKERYQVVEEVRRELCRSVGGMRYLHRKSFIRVIEKRMWLTEK